MEKMFEMSPALPAPKNGIEEDPATLATSDGASASDVTPLNRPIGPEDTVITIEEEKGKALDTVGVFTFF